jgi:riboflavin kinase / FMN adenylyltransferase
LKYYNSLSHYTAQKKSVVTIGTFDGVHVGHQAILASMKAMANEENLETIVLTFFPHPRLVVGSSENFKLLTTIDEKALLLEKLGINNFIVHPFNTDFSELSPEDFVENVLVKQLKAAKVVIGHDHRFGKNRAGDFSDLIRLGEKFNFEVLEITAQQIDDVKVSSTKIRNAFEHDAIEQANEFLGYPYLLSGKVVKGNQIGRTIGFPTANVEIDEAYKLIPKFGVYIVTCIVNQKLYYGVMNIGIKPTISSEKPTIEVHVFDFEDDIYDKNIQVSIIKKIRNEQKFSNLEVLKEQISLDKQTALAYFDTSN